MDKFKKYKLIKLAEIDAGRIGATTICMEGYLAAKNFTDELNKYKIIFYFNNPIANSQAKKMVKRVVNVSPFSTFFMLLKKALLFWKKNDHILELGDFSLHTILSKNKYPGFVYAKPRIYFTEKENDEGLELIKQLGINSGDKWICIHNRDSIFLKNFFPSLDLSYHDYRDFSVDSLKSASEFFASKGYFVLRMGKLQKERLITNNSKIIDYANSSLRNDFLDMYLLANSEFYFGSDCGLVNISFGFKRPCYGINYDSTDFFAGRWHHKWLFIFKRIKCLNTGKMLTLTEIIDKEFSIRYPHLFFKKHNVIPIDNSSEDIKSLAVEIDKEMSGASTQDNEDIRIQKEFWKIYKTCVNKKKHSEINSYNPTVIPRISPSFLRNNIDLLN